MDTHSAERAVIRARKRLAHAVRQQAEACSERAHRRHVRRAWNARRLFSEAQAFLEELALVDDDAGDFA